MPYWFSLDPPAFSAWFGRNSPFLGGVMVPLGGATSLLALATAVFSWRSRTAARSYFAIVAALAGVAAGIYLIEHASLNAKLEAQTLSASEVGAVLRSWRAWHWARVGAGAGAFLAGLLGLARGASAESSRAAP